MLTLKRSEMEALLAIRESVEAAQQRIRSGKAQVLLGGRAGVSIKASRLSTEACWDYGVLCIAAALLNGKRIPAVDALGESEITHALTVSVPKPVEKRAYRRSRLSERKTR